jgi:hypothetical protein
MMQKRKRVVVLLTSLSLLTGILCVFRFLPIGYVHKGDLRLVAPQIAANADVGRLFEQVDVRQIDLSAWTISDSFMRRVLWNAFANTPHERAFNIVSTKNWTNSWVKCRDCLIAKAKTERLDAASLGACLASVEARFTEHTAYGYQLLLPFLAADGERV